MHKVSQRTPLQNGAQAVLASGVALAGIPALQTRARAHSSALAVDYYAKLGVTPFINAAGTYTTLPASTMPDEAQAAIALASRQPVNLNELLDASGAYLAKRCGAKGGLPAPARRRRSIRS
jgi:hypothetical protein